MKLPRCTEAEAVFLGSIFHGLVETGTILALNPDDFTVVLHRAVFARMQKLAAAGTPINLLTVLADIGLNEVDLAVVAGLTEPLNRLPRSQDVVTCVEQIRKKALERELVTLCARIVETNGNRESLCSELHRALQQYRAVNEPANWMELFDSRADFDIAAPLYFAIAGFLQGEAITAIAGLSGHGKTWVALSVIRALLSGPGKLWDWFEVPRRFERIVYLIPESTRSPLKTRLQNMHLYDELGKRLFVRTLNMGPAPRLDDARLLCAVKRAAVVLDTGVRFMRVSDEANAVEIAETLSADMLSLLRAGADCVIPLFHSPKSFGKEAHMTLEGMIRGSSELGAVLATAWGIRQIEPESNIVHIQNLKPRDFLPCGPFELIGRPYLDEVGDFAMLKKPGDCGSLADEQPELNLHNADAHKGRLLNIVLMSNWLKAEPELSSPAVQSRFRELGVELSDSAIRRYRQEIRRKSKLMSTVMPSLARYDPGRNGLLTQGGVGAGYGVTTPYKRGGS